MNSNIGLICGNIAYIYPDEFVHNMDAAFITAAGGLGVGLIEVLPIVILVGVLIPLSLYALDCYSKNHIDEEVA